MRRRAVQILSEGAGHRALAGQLGIPDATARQWARAFAAGGAEAVLNGGSRHRVYDFETKMAVVRDRLEREVRERQEQDPVDWRSIRNRTSNENALNEELRDDRGTNAAELNEAAAGAEARMRANREAYEEGLAEERAIRQRRGQGGESEHRDVRVKGRVTVSFSLTNPVRTSRWLEIPAYRCEEGGEVIVEITVNRAGEVTAARIREGGDECMRQAAIEAARVSLFNIDSSAPARQSGTITYIFIPQ